MCSWLWEPEFVGEDVSISGYRFKGREAGTEKVEGRARDLQKPSWVPGWDMWTRATMRPVPRSGPCWEIQGHVTGSREAMQRLTSQEQKKQLLPEDGQKSDVAGWSRQRADTHMGPLWPSETLLDEVLFPPFGWSLLGGSCGSCPYHSQAVHTESMPRVTSQEEVCGPGLAATLLADLWAQMQPGHQRARKIQSGRLGMWEVVGRWSAVACLSKCQKNWLRGEAYLIFLGKINKQK